MIGLFVRVRESANLWLGDVHTRLFGADTYASYEEQMIGLTGYYDIWHLTSDVMYSYFLYVCTYIKSAWNCCQPGRYVPQNLNIWTEDAFVTIFFLAAAGWDESHAKTKTKTDKRTIATYDVMCMYLNPELVRSRELVPGCGAPRPGCFAAARERQAFGDYACWLQERLQEAVSIFSANHLH